MIPFRRSVDAFARIGLAVALALLSGCGAETPAPSAAAPKGGMTIEPGAPAKGANGTTETGASTTEATTEAPKNEEPKVETPKVEEPPNAADAFPAGKWVSLFDGKTLEGWKPTEFGGEGDVMVEEGQIVMTQGNDMTGVTSTRKDLPVSNYEIEWEGKRVQGNDFFCGLTFPVKMSPCSLILGGWGGAVCGLSSIDGFDASENSTSGFKEFEKDRWYKFKLRVTDPLIVAWIDGEELLSQELEGRKITIRAEVELSKPLGFSTWRTTGAVKNVRLRRIDPKASEAEKVKTDAPPK